MRGQHYNPPGHLQQQPGNMVEYYQVGEGSHYPQVDASRERK